MLLTLLLSLSAWAADPDSVTLQEALERAEESATSVKAAEAGVEAADARVVQARSGLFPTIQAQGSLQYWDKEAVFSMGEAFTIPPAECEVMDGTVQPLCGYVNGVFGGLAQGFSKPTVVREKTTWSTTVRAVQPLTGLGGIAEQLNAAAAGSDAADATLEQARDKARYDAADAWFAALEADAQLEVFKAQVRALEERERSVQLSVDAKVAVKNDLLQVQIAHAQARQGALAIEDMREIAWRRLGIAIGGDGTAVRPAGEVPAPSDAELPSEDALVSQALAERSDVDAMDSNLDAADASARAQGWNLAPQVSAIASATHQEGQSLGSPKDSWFIGLNADWTLWGWGRQHASWKASRASADQLRANVAGMEAGVRLDVASRRRGVQTARVSWDVAKQSVAQAEENLALFRLRYDNGAATTLELLDAESSLVRARSGELSARYGLLRAEAGLRLAVGG